MAGVAWQLRYDDGSTFSNLDGEPHESPPWGCVGVIHPQMIGTDPDWCLVGGDYLLWRPDLGRWFKCGAPGLDDHLMHFGHLIGCVRKGRWIATLDYKAVWKAARDEWGVG